MLLKTLPAGETDPKTGLAWRNMHVTHFPEMGLFETELELGTEKEGHGDGVIRVTYHPSTDVVDGQGQAGEKTLEVPLTPDTTGLREMRVLMHGSPTTGYNMGEVYNGWFSECFGYPVVLAYLGEEGDGRGREILGSFTPAKHFAHRSGINGMGWGLGAVGVGFMGVIFALATPLSMATAGFITALIMAAGLTYTALRRATDARITFADVAPYMIVSKTSVANVSDRLPANEEMDARKFRPNVIVEGAKTAYEEDYWADLVIGEAPVRLLLTANCVRCRSLNVDYSTGKMGTGEAGSVLKKLQVDQRVDSGAKHSPVFGRYAFLGGSGAQFTTISVGDEVVVARRMERRSVFGTFLISLTPWIRSTQLTGDRLAGPGVVAAGGRAEFLAGSICSCASG